MKTCLSHQGRCTKLYHVSGQGREHDLALGGDSKEATSNDSGDAVLEENTQGTRGILT